MRRGEKEECLTLRVRVPEEEALGLLERRFVKARNAAAEQVTQAVHDSFRRLLSLSIETETRLLTKKRADEAAITVFADNLRAAFARLHHWDRRWCWPLILAFVQGAS